jgi:hypothetical protein
MENLVFRFGDGRHAFFPQKLVVKADQFQRYTKFPQVTLLNRML